MKVTISDNINSHSPNNILNIFANIFEKSRSGNDLVSLKNGLNLSSNVDLIHFNEEQKSTFHYFVANGWSCKKRQHYRLTGKGFELKKDPSE